VSVKSLRDGLVEDVPLTGEEWNRARRSLLLWKRDDIEWNTVRFEIEIVAPQKEIEKLGKERADLSVVVSAQCVATNLRQAVIASPSPLDESMWSCSLELDRRNMRGPVSLQAHLAGTVSGQAHRYLASADEWRLYFEQAASPTPRGALPIQWVDFGADDAPVFLKKFVNEPMYADLEGTPLPKIYLNKGFEGLAALFVEKPRPMGARLALHEAERIGMAKGIWLALFQIALAAVEEPEEGEEPDWPDGWQGEVLRKMLARVHPELEPAGRLDKAIQERRSDGARQFESLVLAAVSQDLIKEGKGLRTSLMALEQATREDAL
jgi:hypothetical protein